ncbi:hypothetical protein SAMN04488097_1617 [Epilithonimonas lactis]|uniref:Uncharacterized protein n=1 Tax=Epilithonimonas lactis TaxID=421072 RepID=A0A085BMB5_9FLAO|nr:hypothetical protein IO89_03250 [Epilithonimonas lactis]SEQ19273.1 hypothetical protein SAMN04488097_1617 [Epilithonimonas lactis]
MNNIIYIVIIIGMLFLLKFGIRIFKNPEIIKKKSDDRNRKNLYGKFMLKYFPMSLSMYKITSVFIICYALIVIVLLITKIINPKF